MNRTMLATAAGLTVAAVLVAWWLAGWEDAPADVDLASRLGDGADASQVATGDGSGSS